MKRLIMGFYLSLFLGATAFSTEAGLIEHRSFAGNSDGLIYIADVNQEWINLDLTVGKSMNESLAMYASLGFYAPDITQVSAMLRALGISDNPGTCLGAVPTGLCTHDTSAVQIADYSDPLFTWFNTTGGTVDRPDIFANYSSALSGQSPADILYLFADSDFGNDEDLVIASGYFSADLVFATSANFLVRDVSEPGLFLLLATLIIFLFRRQSNPLKT